MKQITAVVFILLFLFLNNLYASEVSDTFSDKYQALLPQENSSVHSDYLFEQISLGSRYTVMMLDQINDTNTDFAQKTDQVIERLDILIEQNKTIIELLKKGQTQ